MKSWWMAVAFGLLALPGQAVAGSEGEACAAARARLRFLKNQEKDAQKAERRACRSFLRCKKKQTERQRCQEVCDDMPRRKREACKELCGPRERCRRDDDCRAADQASRAAEQALRSGEEAANCSLGSAAVAPNPRNSTGDVQRPAERRVTRDTAPGQGAPSVAAPPPHRRR
ncbi:MAG: hypothetical protein KC613_17155 [Myxococcales bacterium]|nr:hypothetical protein [Myxococcales bacterium]MCB9524626.1 hypothetical protein [Myxococcales bacterium]